MAHRKRKETKLQPGTACPDNMLGCCFVSFHFLWAILCPQDVPYLIPVLHALFYPYFAMSSSRSIILSECSNQRHLNLSRLFSLPPSRVSVSHLSSSECNTAANINNMNEPTWLSAWSDRPRRSHLMSGAGATVRVMMVWLPNFRSKYGGNL